MEKVRVIVGLVLFVCIGTVQSQMEEPAPSVLVNDPMKVKPGQQVVLNCVGSNSSISYYIRNRVRWSFNNMNGLKANLSNGSFYIATKDVYTAELIEQKRIEFNHGAFKMKDDNNADKDVYVFNITLSDIQYSADGEYTCSLYDANDKVIHNQTTSITVVSPVIKLKLELHDIENMVASSESFIEGSNVTVPPPVSVPPGSYKVKCISDGSNPKPKMRLFYNKDQVYVVQKDTKVTTGPGPTYKSTFDVEMLELGSMNSEQLLMCESNIAGDYFQPKMAGINLLVKIETSAGSMPTPVTILASLLMAFVSRHIARSL